MFDYGIDIIVVLIIEFYVCLRWGLITWLFWFDVDFEFRFVCVDVSGVGFVCVLVVSCFVYCCIVGLRWFVLFILTLLCYCLLYTLSLRDVCLGCLLCCWCAICLRFLVIYFLVLNVILRFVMTKRVTWIEGLVWFLLEDCDFACWKYFWLFVVNCIVYFDMRLCINSSGFFSLKCFPLLLLDDWWFTIYKLLNCVLVGCLLMFALRLIVVC